MRAYTESPLQRVVLRIEASLLHVFHALSLPLPDADDGHVKRAAGHQEHAGTCQPWPRPGPPWLKLLPLRDSRQSKGAMALARCLQVLSDHGETVAALSTACLPAACRGRGGGHGASSDASGEAGCTPDPGRPSEGCQGAGWRGARAVSRCQLLARELSLLSSADLSVLEARDGAGTGRGQRGV